MPGERRGQADAGKQDTTDQGGHAMEPDEWHAVMSGGVEAIEHAMAER